MQAQARPSAGGKPVKHYGSEYSDVVADRIESIVGDLLVQIRSNGLHNTRAMLTLPDLDFIFEALSEAIKERALTKETDEKLKAKRRAQSSAKFFSTLENHGGLLKSAEVADLMGVSKVTVKNRKDKGLLLYIEKNGEFFYPVFQFEKDGSLLKEVGRILSCFNDKISDVMKCSFFISKNIIRDGTNESILDKMKNGISDGELEKLARLAKVYGSQSPE